MKSHLDAALSIASNITVKINLKIMLKIKKVVRKNFYAAVVLVIFHVVLGYFIGKTKINANTENIDIIVKTLVIIYVLVSIPLSLKLFSVRLKKIAAIDDREIKALKYIKASRIRMIFILIGLISAIMCVFVMKMNDMAYMVAIEVIIMFFCTPTNKRIEQELSAINYEIT